MVKTVGSEDSSTETGDMHAGQLPYAEGERVQYSCTVHTCGPDGGLQQHQEQGTGQILEVRVSDGLYIILRDEGGLRAVEPSALTPLLPDSTAPSAAAQDSPAAQQQHGQGGR